MGYEQGWPVYTTVETSAALQRIAFERERQDAKWGQQEHVDDKWYRILAGQKKAVLWLRIAMLLLLVLAVGVLSAALAVWSTLKTPVLTALRRE